MHEKKMFKAYATELGGAILTYAVILVVAIRLGRPMDEGVLRTVVLASPMIAFCLAIWAVARHLRRIDEYQRQNLLETLAISGALTGGLTFTYGFLETAGYPRLSMFSVWMVMCSVWCAVSLTRALLNR